MRNGDDKKPIEKICSVQTLFHQNTAELHYNLLRKKKGSGHYTKCTNNLAYNPYVKEWSDFRRWEKYLLQSAHPIYATTAPDIEIPSQESMQALK